MRRLTTPVLTLALGLLLTTAERATAQGPHIHDMAKRSGLISRFAPMMPTGLPQDADRDNFYGTRYGDFASVLRSNKIRGGGMYGQRLDPGCTTCNTPSFHGAPGRSTAFCPNCEARYTNQLARFATTLTHPFKPVGRYYDRGCYVPIYDLDPLVPGPGPDLWPRYHNGNPGG